MADMKVIKDDYISKLEAVRILQKAYAEGRIKAKDGLSSVLNDIQNANVKLVKYSSWEYRTYPIVDRDGVARRCMRGYVCKACGHSEPEEKRFCGGCGAEMRGDDND